MHAHAGVGQAHIIPFSTVQSQKATSNPSFTSPAGALPSTSTAPTTDKDIEANKKKIEESGPLARVLKTVVEWLDYFSDKGVKLSGYPLYWLGSALLIFGAGATIGVLAATLSIEAVLVGYPLATLMLGGLLRELGRAMRDEKDLSTALGNILYVPMRYLIRLTL